MTTERERQRERERERERERQRQTDRQRRICVKNYTRCHTEMDTADQTCYLTQSQYTDTGLTSPSTDPIRPGAWQGRHWRTSYLSHRYDSTVESGIRTPCLRPSKRTSYHSASEAVVGHGSALKHFTRRQPEIEAADQTCYLTDSHTGPTSPCTDVISPEERYRVKPNTTQSEAKLYGRVSHTSDPRVSHTSDPRVSHTSDPRVSHTSDPPG